MNELANNPSDTTKTGTLKEYHMNICTLFKVMLTTEALYTLNGRER